MLISQQAGFYLITVTKSDIMGGSVCGGECCHECVFYKSGSDVPHKVQLLKLSRFSAVCLHQSRSTSNGLI